MVRVDKSCVIFGSVKLHWFHHNRLNGIREINVFAKTATKTAVWAIFVAIFVWAIFAAVFAAKLELEL